MELARHPRRCAVIAFVMLAAACGARCESARAQGFGKEVSFQTDALFDTDDRFERKLSVVRDFVKNAQWKEAIDLIQEIADEHGGNLFEASPGRFVNIGTYTSALLASLPAEARDVYRRRVDAAVHARFLAARERHDEAALRQIVRDAFIAGDADDALWVLGEAAFERGEFATAREDWRRMLPAPAIEGATEPTVVLGYPDTGFDRAAIGARLVLCSIAEGNRRRAARELDAFRAEHADAEGSLAGREGKLAEILGELLDESRTWVEPNIVGDDATFGGTAARDGARHEPVEIGPPLWSATLPPAGFFTPSPRPALDEPGALRHFPAAFGEMLLFAGAGEIEARRLDNGNATWGTAERPSATIFPPLFDARLPSPGLPVGGLPAFTLTVAEGRLYARMGLPITRRARRELSEFESDIACLDLERGQGKILWLKAAGELSDGDDGFWSFEGAPIVVDGRAYAAYQHGDAQAACGVCCLDAATGQVLWQRDVCSAASEISEVESQVSQQLLTVADGRVYYATGFGAVAALSARDGLLEWAVSYPMAVKERGKPDDPLGLRVLPCVSHEGTVVAATEDGVHLLALDAASGLVKWSRKIPGGVQHLLGVGAGGIVASGRDLWCLDIESGRAVWHLGYRDSESRGYGRGVLAGDLVYWPKHEEIQVVDQSTGQLVRNVPLRAFYGETGGNLLIAGKRLVIAQPDRVVVFGGASESMPARERELSLRSRSSPRLPTR